MVNGIEGDLDLLDGDVREDAEDCWHLDVLGEDFYVAQARAHKVLAFRLELSGTWNGDSLSTVCACLRALSVVELNIFWSLDRVE